MIRSDNCLAKLERMNRTLRHEEPDRVPISDFFWGSFVRRWRLELGLPEDASPYSYYDLDWIVTTPNMDPLIREFETIREDDREVVVKTGFLATIRKRFDFPMPEFISFDIDTIEKLQALELDDPADPRRFFSAGDNQIAGVGDCFARNSPAWIETVKKLHPDFPVYGSIIEDFMEMGLDAYNPLEVKAGLDAVKLKEKYGHKLAYCGNNDIQVWETGDMDLIRKDVLRKLGAARNGGYIFQSDHSVSSSVSGHTYDYIVKLVREFGQYPLKLES